MFFCQFRSFLFCRTKYFFFRQKKSHTFSLGSGQMPTTFSGNRLPDKFATIYSLICDAVHWSLHHETYTVRMPWKFCVLYTIPEPMIPKTFLQANKHGNTLTTKNQHPKQTKGITLCQHRIFSILPMRKTTVLSSIY